MKGINEWAKDLKHNEKVAKKFEGVKSVQDILKVAKENGYEFTEQELIDFDLDSVAGGGLFSSAMVNVDAEIRADVETRSVGITGSADNGATINFENVKIRQ